MSADDVIRGARALIAKGWTQGASARDHRGQPTSPLGPFATSFCLIGAIKRVQCGEREAEEARAMIRERIGDGELIANWNDAPGRTQAEVLEVLDRCR